MRQRAQTPNNLKERTNAELVHEVLAEEDDKSSNRYTQTVGFTNQQQILFSVHEKKN